MFDFIAASWQAWNANVAAVPRPDAVHVDLIEELA